MPYKDQERKRQWEREHREQRNGQRRASRLGINHVLIPQTAMPDADTTTKTVWIAGLVLGIALVLVAVLSVSNLSGSAVRTGT